MQFDAYLLHASEDADLAGRLVEELRSRGLRVWYNNFLVGPSIREQMEGALARADFGIVLVSPRFFGKKWTRHELDAMFGLEQPGEVRLLPVWHNVSAEDVRLHSPMLAMRSAAVLDDDVTGVAQQLFQSITALSAAKSPARILRLRIAAGFPWTVGPKFLPGSLSRYDESFKDYAQVALAHYPNTTDVTSPVIVPLMELVRTASLWDGQEITVIARQPRETVQVLGEVVGPEDLPVNPSRPEGVGFVEYVFQLASVDFINGELCYVHCIGPYSRKSPGWGPYSPDPTWLCVVSGLMIAYGVMPNDKGKQVNAVYLVASRVYFMPPVQAP